MKMKKNLVSRKLTSKLARLSQLSFDAKEQEYFTQQFNETLETIDKLNSLNTLQVAETNQVTGLSNIFRDDVIEKGKMLSQKQALSNAKTTHEGYFVVKALFS